MNPLQRIVLGVGLLAVCLSLVFIPYEASYRTFNSSRVVTAHAGYGFLATQPSTSQCARAIENVIGRTANNDRCSTAIDKTRIGLQLGAIVTLMAALVVLAGLVGRRSFSSPAPSPPTMGDVSAAPAPENPRPSRPSVSPGPPAARTVGFRELLLQHMPGLPVGRGTLHEHDPLVITEDIDHVSVEYQVMNFIIGQDRAREYRKTGQRLLSRGHQHVDVLTYVTRPVGAKDWSEETVSYYFDITAGFNRMQAGLED